MVGWFRHLAHDRDLCAALGRDKFWRSKDSLGPQAGNFPWHFAAISRLRYWAATGSASQKISASRSALAICSALKRLSRSARFSLASPCPCLAARIAHLSASTPFASTPRPL